MKNPVIRKLIVSVALLIGGVVFIVFGCISFKEVKTFPEVSAVVTKVETEWVDNGDEGMTEEKTAYVKYTVDGVEYNEILQNSPGNVEENTTITVRYNPEKPNYVTGSTKTSGTIQLALGIVLTLVSIGSAAVTVIKGR
ncbi:MAG: DUF3592 domain-containing protein [Clostridia bacterium]|nr:DUF3592 domain-containing protein [Clostridia bacterium]